MLIKKITKNNSDAVIRKVKASFVTKGVFDFENENIKGFNTKHFSIREKKYWNTLGREIYSPMKVKKLATALDAIITSLECEKWFYSAYVESKLWKNIDCNKFSSKFFNSKNKQRKDNNISIFQDFLLLENLDKDFLGCLIEVGFLFHTPDITLYSLKLPLALHFGHHLDISIMADNEIVLKKVKKLFLKNKITISNW